MLFFKQLAPVVIKPAFGNSFPARRGHPVVNIAEKRDRCILLRCRCIMVNIIFAFSATTYGCYIQLIARSSKPFAEDMPWNNIKPCCGERGVLIKLLRVVLLTEFSFMVADFKS